MWLQRTIEIPAKSRGFHLVTSEITAQSREIETLRCGLLHLFLQHTSASLTLNENADITVREDFERYFNHSVKESAGYFKHTMEGPDDMPAHIKSSLLGVSLTIPINNRRLNLGAWQGIYLGEHRNHASSRSIVITLQGETT